jgi:hypothetical protein
MFGIVYHPLDTIIKIAVTVAPAIGTRICNNAEIKKQ